MLKPHELFLCFLFCLLSLFGCKPQKTPTSEVQTVSSPEDLSSQETLSSSEKSLQKQAPDLYSAYLALKSEERPLRQKAKNRFLQAKSKAILALPLLVELLQKQPQKEVFEIFAQLEGAEDSLKNFLPVFLVFLSKEEWKLSVIPILGRIGPNAKEATPLLREALLENNLYLVIASIRALVRIEKQPESFLLFLVELLQKEEHLGVIEAIGEAFYLQQESPRLLALFSKQNLTVQLRFLRAYEQIPEETILAELFKLLAHSEAKIRQITAKVLEKFRFASERILPILESFFLQESEIEGKISAASTLILLGCRSPQVLAFMENAFHYPDAEIRAEVVCLFKKVDFLMFQKNIPALLKALQDEAQEVRKASIEVFRVQKHFPSDSLPLLLQLLQTEEEDLFVKLGAISVLGEMRSKEALPLLIHSFLNEKNMLLHSEAKKSLVLLGRVAIPALWNVFKNQELDLLFRGQALSTLGEIGYEAKELLPQLEATLEKENHLMLRGLLKKTIARLKATE